LRYRNPEHVNKSWLEESHWICLFCGDKDKDCVEHYVGMPEKDWFVKL